MAEEWNFYVYGNWTRKRACVHRGDCSMCNDGRGKQPIDSGKNGEWSGPYVRDAAFAKAKSYGYADVSACSFCRP